MGYNRKGCVCVLGRGNLVKDIPLVGSFARFQLYLWIQRNFSTRLKMTIPVLTNLEWVKMELRKVFLLVCFILLTGEEKLRSLGKVIGRGTR